MSFSFYDPCIHSHLYSNVTYTVWVSSASPEWVWWQDDTLIFQIGTYLLLVWVFFYGVFLASWHCVHRCLSAFQTKPCQSVHFLSLSRASVLVASSRTGGSERMSQQLDQNTNAALISASSVDTKHVSEKVACLDDMRPHHHLVWSALHKRGRSTVAALVLYIQTPISKGSELKMAVPCFVQQESFIKNGLDDMLLGGLVQLYHIHGPYVANQPQTVHVEYQVTSKLQDELKALRKADKASHVHIMTVALQSTVLNAMVLLYKASGVKEVPSEMTWCLFHHITCFAPMPAEQLGFVLQGWCKSNKMLGPAIVNFGKTPQDAVSVTACVRRKDLGGITAWALDMQPLELSK
jgi:hypothetical protein